MDLKNVTSQLDRHQMLMDLAKAVKDHVDQNPDLHGEQGGTDVPEYYPLAHFSSK